MEELKLNLKSLASDLGFADCKVTDEISLTMAESHFRKWIEKKYNYKMSFLERNIEKYFDLKKVLPEAKSTIVCSISYNFKQPVNKDLKISRYALIKDYHTVILEKLKRIDNSLCEKVENYKSKIYVDTGPVLEKQIARAAGIGWQGRNSLIISQEYGSWIFLGVIITNLDLPKDEKVEDRCGDCRLCIENCPTQAITENRNIDAAKCIAYWTIESKEDEFPDFIRKNQNKWAYGCDICQEICPWNKNAKAAECKDFVLQKDISSLSRKDIEEMNESQFKETFKDSPIYRIGLKRLKRNIEGV